MDNVTPTQAKEIARAAVPKFLRPEFVDDTPPTDGQSYVWSAAHQRASWASLTGGASPVDAQYLTLASNAVLTGERVFTPGTGLSAVDGGAGGAYTLNGHLAVTLDADADTLLSLTTQTLGLDTQTANRVLAGPTTGGAAVPTFRALVAADIPSAIGAHALLDGSVNSDTTVSSVTRGDLIIGNSTPAWDDLAIGSANSVLWTDGIDPSWATHPRLGFVADTGGTDRLTLGTTAAPGPNVTITGYAQLSSGALGINIAPASIATGTTGGAYLYIQDTAASNDGKWGALINIGLSNAPSNTSLYGMAGRAVANQSASQTIAALSFYAGLTGTGWNSATCTSVTACELRLNATNSVSTVISDFYGFNLQAPIISANGLIVTRYGGVFVTGVNNAKIQNFWGYKFLDATPGSGTWNAGTLVVPLYMEGPARTTNVDGSVHKMNLWLGSLNRSFGGGAGVLGLAYCTTVPTTNPASGGVFYIGNGGGGTNNTAGTLYYRGSAGTVTPLGIA